MNPRLYYAVFMSAALVVALAARYFVPKPPEFVQLPWWKRAVIGAAAFVGGVLGAKIPFVLVGEESWFTGAAWLTDGKTIVTGMIGAYLLVELAKLGLGVRVRTGDTFALPLALAMSVGRWGCFFAGCCAGVVTDLPWGMDFGDHVRRHPTQLYEIVFHLSMAAVLWIVMRRNFLVHQRLKLYLIGYGVFRFLVEFLRPEPSWWLGLSVYQWASIMLVVPMCIQWHFHRPIRPSTD
jgi:prolipoprotein diacylglyceryltransferase